MQQIGNKTWTYRSTAEKHLSTTKGANSVQYCLHCGDFFLSSLLTPSDSAFCSRLHKRKTNKKDPTSDWNYHGVHRPGTI